MNLHVKVVEARDIPKMDTFGKCDPYCFFTMNTCPNSYKTKVIKKTYTPKWNEQFTFPAAPNSILSVTLYDYDEVGTNDYFGKLDIAINSLAPGLVADQWFKITPKKGIKKAGELHLVLHYAPAGAPLFQPVQVAMYAPPPQGYPPQPGYPPQGYPPQGYPPQPGYPPQGYPPQPGMPPQGYPPQPGMPPQGYPPQPGMPPQQGYPSQPGMHPPQPGYPPQPGMPPQQPVYAASTVVVKKKKSSSSSSSSSSWSLDDFGKKIRKKNKKAMKKAGKEIKKMFK